MFKSTLIKSLAVAVAFAVGAVVLFYGKKLPVVGPFLAKFSA